MKTCTRCKKEQPLDSFGFDKQKRDGRSSWCRSCVAKGAREYNFRPEIIEIRKQRHRDNYSSKPKRDAILAGNKRWRKSESGREIMREYGRQWQKKNPEKHRAHAMLFHQVKMGRIIRKTACEKCGGGGIIHAHHHKGYDKPNYYNVQWLCVICHAAAHHQGAS